MPISEKIIKNLGVQGFACDDPQFEAIEPWLRFNPSICFIIGALGLYFASAAIFFILAVFAAIGAFSPHAVGDMIYNYGIRYFAKTPPLPANPSPRRFACFVGTVWSLAIALAFTYGSASLAYVLGIVLLLVIIPMIARHWCIASLMYQVFISPPSNQ